MTLTTRVAVTISAALTSALDLVTAGAPAVVKFVLDLAHGSGANQANKVFTDQRTIAASTTEDLDLNGGGLLDALGTVLVFAQVRVLYIKAAIANVNNITLFGDANSVPILGTAATTVTLKPGGIFLFVDPSAAGVAVTAGTGDIIQVANAGAGTSVVYDIIIVGS